MIDLEDIIDETASAESVFRDKSALDPLAEPETIVGREDQQCRLTTILNDVTEGYLPPIVAIYGSPNERNDDGQLLMPQFRPIMFVQGAN